MKKVLLSISLLFLSLFICSCGSDGGGSGAASVESVKLYLAENVILDRNVLRTAQAQEFIVDTETQVMAENVLFANTLSSNIESGNVQEALEEISLILTEVMVGTWSIQNFHHDSVHEDTGRIQINNDGTFDLIEGSFAAIGMGSGYAEHDQSDMFVCDHVKEGQSWESFVEDIVEFSWFAPNSTLRTAVIPRFVKLRQNQIVFIGRGGCGLGKDRVSVLTREIG
jgi:hypothetical protein